MVRTQEKGFTIIELVVVIVILGILAAVAFPKFQDLSGDAKTSVVAGAKAALLSAAVITYAKNSGNKQPLLTIQNNTLVDGVTLGGTCGAATVTLVSDGAYSATVNLNDYCS